MHSASKLRKVGARAMLGLAVLTLTITTGCQTGAGTGALVGGTGGALLGNAVAKAAGGSRTAGTVLGGALGAIGGAVVGDNVDQANARADRAEARTEAVAAAATAQAPLGLTDVAKLAQQGVTDNVIINQIRTTGSTYRLSAEDIVYLKQNLVSDVVISEMQASSTRVVPSRRVYTAVPVHPGPAPVIYEPVRPVGVGFSYRSGR